MTRLRLDREASREQTRAKVQTLFRSIRALGHVEMNKSAIARLLGFHRHTVQKYSGLEFTPEKQPGVRKVSALAPYEDYILDASRTDAPTQPRSTSRSSDKIILARTATFGASSST